MAAPAQVDLWTRTNTSLVTGRACAPVVLVIEAFLICVSHIAFRTGGTIIAIRSGRTAVITVSSGRTAIITVSPRRTTIVVAICPGRTLIHDRTVILAVGLRRTRAWIRPVIAIIDTWRPTVVISFNAIRLDVNSAIPISSRRLAPAITIAIEVTAAIVAIPIAIDAEGHGRNAQGLIILWSDIDPLLRIGGLKIAARDPAAVAAIGNVAPVRGRQAAVDFNRAAGRHNQNRRIFCAGSRSHVDVRGGISGCGTRNRWRCNRRQGNCSR